MKERLRCSNGLFNVEIPPSTLKDAFGATTPVGGMLRLKHVPLRGLDCPSDEQLVYSSVYEDAIWPEEKNDITLLTMLLWAGTDL